MKGKTIGGIVGISIIVIGGLTIVFRKQIQKMFSGNGNSGILDKIIDDEKDNSFKSFTGTTTTKVNIREAPNTTAKIICNIPSGISLKAVLKVGNWYKLKNNSSIEKSLLNLAKIQGTDYKGKSKINNAYIYSTYLK